MVTPRVSRAVNPQRKRKLTLKQIRAGFGGKRRQASLKGSRHKHKARKAKASNPKKAKRRASAKRKNPATKVVYRTKYKTRTKKVYVTAPKKRKRKANPKRKRRSNPGSYLASLVPVGNPQRKRRKTSMAKRRRKVSAKGRSGKRRNPTRRRSVARKTHRARNPGLDTGLVKKAAGVFVGFSAAKKLPPMLGASMNSSPMMTLLSTAITAAVLSYATKRFAPGPFAEGVMWGGLGGVFNMAWNTWAPPMLTSYWPGVSGMGDFVAGGFPLPQGPVRMPIAAAGYTPNGSQVDVGAFGTAFTRAW